MLIKEDPQALQRMNSEKLGPVRSEWLFKIKTLFS